MAPSCSANTMRVVTTVLLLLSIAYAVALPATHQEVQYAPDIIEARAPSDEIAITHDVDTTVNEKKTSRNFFKELGSLLSEFDPVELFRSILGNILGFRDSSDEAASSSASLSPTTTVIITPTPVEASSTSRRPFWPPHPRPRPARTSLTTTRTTITSRVTTTQVVQSSVESSFEVSFSPFPIFPTEESSGSPTEVATPDHTIFTPIVAASVSAEVSAEVSADVEEPTLTDDASIPTETSEPVETFSILPFIPSGADISDNVVIPETTEEVPPLETFSVVTAPVTDFPEATVTPEPEETSSVLPSGPAIENASEFVTPETAEEVPPLETFSVVTAPVTDVPEATLLPVESTEMMSILPWFPPSETPSEEVTEPTPTSADIPVFTGSENPFAEDITTSTEELEATASAQVNVSSPVPLLEFVNGTYVLPTTKTPDVVTPVASWPPAKSSSRRRPRPTRPIHLPPPIIRPTNFPLNQTFFANQTKAPSTPVAKSSRPLILTSPLRPKIESFPTPAPKPRPSFPFFPPRPPRPFFPRPFFNRTRSIRPTAQPTRPLILTNPLRPTIEAVPTEAPIRNSTTFVQWTRPFIVTDPPLPTVETFNSSVVEETTTTIITSRSTTTKTIIVIPTPAPEDVPDVSIVDVDTPTDEPVPSDTGFTGPGDFPFDEGEDENAGISENPIPTFPIITGGGESDLSSDAAGPTLTPVSDDYIRESSRAAPTETEVVNPDFTPISVEYVVYPSQAAPTPEAVESDVEPTPPDSNGFSEFAIPSASPTPTPTPTPSLLLDLDDLLTKIPTIGIGLSLNLKLSTQATPSLGLAISLPGINLFPTFTPTPTPRTFVQIPSSSRTISTPVLPPGFPLPTPEIGTKNVTFDPSAGRLADICTDKNVSAVTIPLLQKWYGPNAYPSLKPFPGCVLPNPRQALQAPGLLNCTTLGKEVQTCQKAGKRILLGIRVDSPAAVNGNLKWGSANAGDLGLKLPLQLPPGPFAGRPGHPLVPLLGNLTTVVLDGLTISAPNLFDALHVPTSLASTLFSLFGEGHAERADLRPLGPDAPSAFSPDGIKWITKPLGEEVVVDGFDVRTPGQWKGTPQAALVDTFVGALRDSVQKAWTDGGAKVGAEADLGVDGPGVVVSGWI